MSELGEDIRGRLSALWRWLLDCEGKLFGILLGTIALRQVFTFLDRLDQYWIYLVNGIYATPLLSLAVTGLSVAYMAIIAVILYVSRKPVARYEALMPNLLAVMAGFGLYLFGLLEPASRPLVGVCLPLSLLIAGVVIVLWSLAYLRRAFSVLPQARTFVQSGPYSLVRHPMYLGNILTIIGLGLLLSTAGSILLALSLSLLQVCRAHYEDRLLAATFEDYGGYMAKVNAFIPPLVYRKAALAAALVTTIMTFSDLGDIALAQSNRAKHERLCRAWHQKALSGRWFSAKEAEEFMATEALQEDMVAIPACEDFFALQTVCQNAALGLLVAEGEPGVAGQPSPAYLAAARELLDLIESKPACKAIAGASQVCPALVTTAKKGKALTPRQKAILAECADTSIAQQSAGLMRGAL